MLHESVSKALTSGWGGAVTQIPFYVYEHDGFRLVDGESRTDEQLCDDMTELLRGGIYSDTKSISLYCILDTTEVESCAEFEKWYFAIERIKTLLNTPLTTMLLLVVNDELNQQKKSVEIKRKLCEIYQNQNNSHIYEGVFVLGRRLRNGAYSDANSGSSGNLLANIMLLSNTADDGKDHKAHLYKSNCPALTVSYSSSVKPNADIAVITLKAIVAKLSEMFNQGIKNEQANQAMLAKIIELDKGKSDFYERVFVQLSEHFPSYECLSCLPRRTQGELDFEMSFTELNHETYGCLSAFLEKNYFSVIEELFSCSLKNEVVSELKKKICEQLTAVELYEGVSDDVRTAVFKKAEVGFSTEGGNALDTIKIKWKNKISKELRGVINEVLDELTTHSKACVDGFEQIKKSIALMPAAPETGTGLHLVRFYTDKASRYLNMESSAKILTDVFAVHNTESDILDVLFSAMESCFESAPVYRFSYIEEMYERLGVNDIHTATNQIIGELIDSLDEKIRFYSATVFSNNRIFEAYFFNISTPETLERLGENGLYERLKNRELPLNTSRTFFNTYNNDIIESMWFYECREQDLLAEL